jgi:bidirectional [NiFe] hydrogenase diaphorase subunit
MLEEQYGIKAGETTPDGVFSLITARCLGSCGLAPVAVLDGEVRGKDTPDSVSRRVAEMIAATVESKQTELEDA